MSLLERLEQGQGKVNKAAASERSALKSRIHQAVIEQLGKSQVLAPGDNLEEKIREVAQEIVRSEIHMTPTAREQVIKEIINDAVGYGPIQELLQDPGISEVMVNGKEQVFVERDGRLEVTTVRFDSEEQLLSLIERIVAPLGRRIDESMPMVDARLKDGSRVNAIIPPLSLRGPILTIRKFSQRPLEIDDLVNFGTLSEQMAEFLEAGVKARLNIVVSGGTGSGKTTTLNVLSSFIPDGERIVTIEDAAELQLMQRHVVPLETRPANIEGRGEVTIRDLVRNALRMRPDRIVVGEVRSGETLDMLQAMNTGHDGSLTTAHANSPRDTLSRLETMVLMAGMELPVRAIREQIAAAIDLIIQQSRMSDGKRRITHITEVQGMEGDVIVLQDLFRYEPNGRGDGYRSTGMRPKFYEQLARQGPAMQPGMFARLER